MIISLKQQMKYGQLSNEADRDTKYKWLDHSNSTLKTSHSLVRNCPLGCPVKAKEHSGERMYLPLLQLIGNSALERSLLLLSTMQMSQHPKMGPFSGLLAIANCARFKLNFSRMLSEKMKLLSDLSAAHCFLAELHAIGVQPPIILLNSVYTSRTVPPTPSHFLWNSLIEQPFYEALKRRVRLAILLQKRRWMGAMSLIILLGRVSWVILSSGVEAIQFFLSLRVPGLRQRSLVVQSMSNRSCWSATTQFSMICGDSTFLAEYISARMGVRQLPVMRLQLPSVRFLMNFITSMLKPQVFTQSLNLACSALIFSSRLQNMRSTLSRRYWNCSERRFGLSQIMPSTQDHRTFSHPS